MLLLSIRPGYASDEYKDVKRGVRACRWLVACPCFVAREVSGHLDLLLMRGFGRTARRTPIGAWSRTNASRAAEWCNATFSIWARSARHRRCLAQIHRSLRRGGGTSADAGAVSRGSLCRGDPSSGYSNGTLASFARQFDRAASPVGDAAVPWPICSVRISVWPNRTSSMPHDFLLAQKADPTPRRALFAAHQPHRERSRAVVAVLHSACRCGRGVQNLKET